MKRIIVTRFSAMGDVAMVASVLSEFQEQHLDTEIIMVSRKLFSPFFDNIPRLTFHVIEPKARHKGLIGLYSLYRELRMYTPDAVADLHNNIRSRVIGGLFYVSGFKMAALDKGRLEKKALTRTKNKIKHQLKLTTERYADVFRKLGFQLTLKNRLVKTTRTVPSQFEHQFSDTGKNIGIAPFAQHQYKVFPLNKMEEVVQYLSKNGYNVFIFGGGKQEEEIAKSWQHRYSNVINTIGQTNIAEELNLIANLDLMVSMDSSGMHMASLVGTRCISIWGATHPFAGFLGYGQSYGDVVQVEHPNRPSSVYGNKPCDCDGVEAIDLVSSQLIINHIKSICE